MLNKFLGVLGGLIAIVSVPFVFAFAFDVFDAKLSTSDKGTAAGLAIFFAAVAFAGVMQFRRSFLTIKKE